MISLYFVLTGFITIVFNDRMEFHLAFLLPAIMTVLFGLVVGFSLINKNNRVLVKGRIDSIIIMGFLYSLISLGTLLYKLKLIGGTVPDSFALSIAFSYLAISITTSMSGLILHGLFRGIFMKSQSAERVEWKRALSA